MAGLELNESTGDLDLGYLPDEWSVFHDYDRTHYVQDLDHNWFEKSLLSPLQLGISSYPTSVQKGLPAVLPNSMSLVHPRYTTSETSMSSLEDPRSRDPRPTSEHQQKRRPRSKPFKDGESAVERRRTQVRLAQQAYRRRKDATQVSLQDECNYLRGTLIKIETTFENFYSHAVSRKEPQRKMEAGFLLEGAAKQLRSLWKNLDHPDQIRAADVRGTEIGVESLMSYETEAHMSMIGHGSGLDSIDFVSSVQGHTVPSSEISASYETPYPRRNPIEDSQSSRVNIPQHRVTGFDPSNEPGVPFFARLRHEGLKRGYNLLTVKETPYSVICQSFRFCIFTSTRSQITKHMEGLLQSSSASAFEALSRYVPPNENRLPRDMNLEYHSHSINGRKILSAITALPARTLPGALKVPSKAGSLAQDGISDYMDSEAVQEYLSNKGLVVQSGVSHISLSRDPTDLAGTGANFFGELLGTRGLTLSVGKFLQELLTRSVCLSTGPGFRAAEVDEAIQSTILASLNS